MPNVYLGQEIYIEIVRLGVEPNDFVYRATRQRLDDIAEGKIKLAHAPPK